MSDKNQMEKKYHCRFCGQQKKATFEPSLL